LTDTEIAIDSSSNILSPERLLACIAQEDLYGKIRQIGFIHWGDSISSIIDRNRRRILSLEFDKVVASHFHQLKIEELRGIQTDNPEAILDWAF
jgi:hypothetical protein